VYLSILPKHEGAAVPHEVVGLVIKEGMDLVKAWLAHLGLTQKEIMPRKEEQVVI